MADVKNLFTNTSAPRGALVCPGCGTLWRVWPQHRQAKFHIHWPLENTYPYQRAHQTDMDDLIAEISKDFPALEVNQHQDVYPADDDGLWRFSLPGLDDTIQLESWSWTAPFSLETSTECVTLDTLTETRDALLRLITQQGPSSPAS